MVYRLLVLTACVLPLNCKRSTGFYNQKNGLFDAADENKVQEYPQASTNSNSGEKKQITTSKNDLETITAGDGLTVGNGQNESEEIEKEKNKINIIGFFLTSCSQSDSKLICPVPDSAASASEYLATLVFYDSSGTELSVSELKAEVIKENNGTQIHIEAPADRQISQIITKETLSIIDNLSSFISNWIRESEYSESKDAADISFNRQADQPNGIVLTCKGNCPNAELIKKDALKHAELCKLLDEASKIQGMINDEYFTTLQSSCLRQAIETEGNTDAASPDAVLDWHNVGSGGSIPDSFGTWIKVPGDPDYDTKDFCVMKYEAKCSLAEGENCKDIASSESPTSKAEGTPWVNISQIDAISECASLGEAYHLITNDEWMTIGGNVTTQGVNWDGGIVGTNELTQGHSDKSPSRACAANLSDLNAYVENNCNGSSSGTFHQRRTFTLSNGEVIWDLAGNVKEWTSYLIGEDKPVITNPTFQSEESTGITVPNSSFPVEYTDITGTATMPLKDLIPQTAIARGWNSTMNIGKYFNPGSTDERALTRGGSSVTLFNAAVGVFQADLTMLPSGTGPYLGFRCVFSAP